MAMNVVTATVTVDTDLKIISQIYHVCEHVLCYHLCIIIMHWCKTTQHNQFSHYYNVCQSCIIIIKCFLFHNMYIRAHIIMSLVMYRHPIHMRNNYACVKYCACE